MVVHFVKDVANLPADIARKLIELGVAEDLDSMLVVPTPEPLRDRIAKKGVSRGADDES